MDMKQITKYSQLDLNATYTYADYLTWKFDEMVEIVKGKLLPMSPAPNTKHQRISIRLASLFQIYFEGKTCEVFVAPFDVRLYDKKKSVKANKDILTVVQPDICVICDAKKVDEKGCLGAPDLMIEILSLGNSKRDLQIKYELYEESGVKEYWIVDPVYQTVQQFALGENDKFQHIKMWLNEDIISPTLFTELKIDLSKVFYNL
jgi:Uma2 family endonuclease